MKKFLLPVIALISIAIVTIFICIFGANKDITSKEEIDTIKQDAHLDILVNLGNFSKDSYSESMLLDVAMQYATEIGLANDGNQDDVYFQYVEKDTLHTLISELTGLYIEAPIVIDDFYYLYDSENSYYYYLGSSPEYFKISKINKIERNGEKIFINCDISKNEDGESTNMNNIAITLGINPKNNLTKYSVIQIDF